MPIPNEYVIREPRQAERYLASFRVQLSISVGVGALVALIARQPIDSAVFWTMSVGTGIGTLLVLHFLRDILFEPRPHAGEVQPDPARLTASITSAVRTTYAISSNWITLWRSSIFRYYLHLDAASSLINYSYVHQSPLKRFSTSEGDQKRFYDEGMDLLDEIGRGEPRPGPHRIRILIYPKWVYDKNSDEMLRLIRSHSAARIPCIPLVADDLYYLLSNDQRSAMRELVGHLEQSILDKAPPRAPMIRSLMALRLKFRIGMRREWRAIFPDFLLVDVDQPSDTSALWWYYGNGDLDDTDREDTLTSDAYDAFRVLCRVAPRAMWKQYGPDRLGGVPVAATSDRLYSEAFFALEHYERWLAWIASNRRSNGTAESLHKWMEQERQEMVAFAAEAIAESGNGHPAHFIDVGCGRGRDIITLLRAHEGLTAKGIDIIERNVLEANRRILKEGLDGRAHVFPDDAAELNYMGEGTIDFAICMTNTLGNLPPEKQEALVRRLGIVLRPGGRVLFSVYGADSITPRLESYGAIDLRVVLRDDAVRAAEGLLSHHFNAGSLLSLVEDGGLRIVETPKRIGRIGLVCVAERP